MSGGPEQFALFELSSSTAPLAPQSPEHPGDDKSDEPGEPLAESVTVASAGPDEPEPDEPTADDTTTPPAPGWESLPVGAEADEHALIVTAAGTYTPSGRELTGPVDSVEKLDKLVRWASLGADREFPDQRRPRHRLRQLAAHPVVAVAQRRTAALLPVRGVPARGGN